MLFECSGPNSGHPTPGGLIRGSFLNQLVLAAALCLLLFPVNVDARTGDFWAPTTKNVPVYDGPDKSFPIQHYIGPSDVVRQKSDNKIRGFIKVEIPKYSQAPGYVLERQLVFLGGTESTGFTGNAATQSAVMPSTGSSTTPESEEAWNPGSGLVVITLVGLLCVGLAYLGYRYRTTSAERIRMAVGRIAALKLPYRFRGGGSGNNAPADDYEIFRTVADELDAKQIDRALWTQALALSEGDAKRQEAIYVRLRAERLRDEQQKEERQKT